MADLIRKIEKADVPQVKELVEKTRPGTVIADIMRLGGMTNHSYRVKLEDGQELLVRIPGEGTEEMIVRTDEKKSTELACNLGIDSQLYYFGDDGKKVMEFIKDPQPMTEETMRRPDIIRQAAQIFKRLHNCGVDTGVRFEVFEMAALYERIITDSGVEFYDDYKEIKNIVMNIKNEVDSTGVAPRVPCHNDSLIGNWVLSGEGKLYLIDWEYSGMNEAMWDLSCLSIEAEYSSEDDEKLMEYYFGYPPTVEQKKRFIAGKLYVDFLWTLWGLTRVPFDGDFMQEYADCRYFRLKNNISKYKSI